MEHIPDLLDAGTRMSESEYLVGSTAAAYIEVASMIFLHAFIQSLYYSLVWFLQGLASF